MATPSHPAAEPRRSFRRERLALLVTGISLAACRDKSAFQVAATSASASASSAPTARATTPAAPSPSSATALAFYADRFSKRPSVPGMTDLGRRLFFDPALSASGKMACATCHDPHFAYGPPNDRATQLGGSDLKLAGLRAVPSLRYQQTIPGFTEHFFEEAADESVDRGPTGGHTWDGRADTLHDQARLPLVSPLEMANASIEVVVKRVEQAVYAKQFQEVFGDDVFSDPVRSSTAVLLVLEVFQQSAKDFFPYTSRYDAWLRKQLRLSAREQRGLALFNDPKKGNCASCHPSLMRQGAFPQFTDFGFNALGVPRNETLPANADPLFFDQGLCGPLRTDLASHPEYCGLFRAPSLRNVALRRVFFHNGVMHHLRAAIEFYAQRDTTPAKFFGKIAGKTDKFDDLPAGARKNVNQDPPFGRKPGEAPTLSAAEIDDLIVFLQTLTDEDLTASAAKP